MRIFGLYKSSLVTIVIFAFAVFCFAFVFVLSVALADGLGRVGTLEVTKCRSAKGLWGWRSPQ